MSTFKRIMCPTCRGAGYTATPRTRDDHGSSVLCALCEGDRVVEEVTTVTHRRVYDHATVPALKRGPKI